MSITKNIVDLIIKSSPLKSEAGQGSEFIVDLFCLGQKMIEANGLPQLEGLRALVADDDTDTCPSVSTMLPSKIRMRRVDDLGRRR